MFFPNKSIPHAVRAESALTASYVAGNVFSVDEQNMLGIMVQYTKGTETGMSLKIESSIDGGVTYGQQVAEAATGGTVAVSLAERSFTASGNYWIIVNPIKAYQLKISVKSNSADPTGTCKLDAITGWV